MIVLFSGSGQHGPDTTAYGLRAFQLHFQSRGASNRKFETMKDEARQTCRETKSAIGEAGRHGKSGESEFNLALTFA
jgi:hypothetical protein